MKIVVVEAAAAEVVAQKAVEAAEAEEVAAQKAAEAAEAAAVVAAVALQAAPVSLRFASALTNYHRRLNSPPLL
jgi:hypothetical protein